MTRMTYPPAQGQYQGPGAPPPIPEGLQLSQHVGDLVWIKVLSVDPAFEGKFGTKPALIMDIEPLTGSAAGQRTAAGIFTNVLLVKQLSQSVGQDLFGRIQAQPGNNANPAIYLAPPAPGDEQYVNAFLARNGGPAAPTPAQPSAPTYAQPAPAPYAAPAQVPYGAPAPAQTPAYGQQPYMPPNGHGQPAVPAGMPPASPPPGLGQYEPPPF